MNERTIRITRREYEALCFATESMSEQVSCSENVEFNKYHEKQSNRVSNVIQKWRKAEHAAKMKSYKSKR